MLRFLMIFAAKIWSDESFLIHFLTEENRPLKNEEDFGGNLIEEFLTDKDLQ